MSLQLSISTLTRAAAIGSALVASVTFGMAGLGRAEPEQGMHTMRGINESAGTSRSQLS